MNNKLITSSDDNIMAWGKYRGRPLSDIPDTYIRWMYEETDLKEHVKEDTEKGSIARYFKLAYEDLMK